MANATSERIERALRAYSDEGVEGLLRYTHPDFSMTTTSEVAAEPDTYEGHDGIRRYFESFFEIMDKVEIHPVAIESRGEAAMVHFRLVARGRSTGLEAEQQGFALFELDGGLLRGLSFFTNEADLRSAFDDSG